MSESWKKKFKKFKKFKKKWFLSIYLMSCCMDSLVFLLGKAQHTQESPRWMPSTQKHPTIHWRSTLKSPNSSTSCSGHHSYNKNCDAFMLDWYRQNVVRSAVAASSPDSVLPVPKLWRSVVEGRHWLGSTHPVNSEFKFSNRVIRDRP